MKKKYFGLVTDKIIYNVETESDIRASVIGIVEFGNGKPNPFDCGSALEEYKKGEWIYLFYGEIKESRKGTYIGYSEYVTSYGKPIIG